MNSAVFRKAMVNGRRHRDTKFIATKERRNYCGQNETIIQQKSFQVIY